MSNLAKRFLVSIVCATLQNIFYFVTQYFIYFRVMFSYFYFSKCEIYFMVMVRSSRNYAVIQLFTEF